MMSRHRGLVARILAVLAVPLAVTACGDDDPADPVTVEISGDHGLAVGATLTLSATTEGADDSGYTWASSNDSVATVDSSGVVTGVAVGETTITATGVDSGVSGDHAIVVTVDGVIPDGGVPPDPGVTVMGNPFIAVGTSETFTATTIAGEDGSYTWSSSDESIATVDASGVVTGVADGTATITATGDDTGASGSLVVRVSVDIPNYEEWMASAHADYSAEAFTHWNEDDPAEIPTSCAKCHSTPGYLDYLGADGSAFEVVDSAAPVGTVIECQSCHNPVADTLDQVTFPSGVTLTGLDSAAARCMTCHQGRNSTDSVNEHITAAAATDADTVDEDLGFQNIHYFSAGATLYGGTVRGGYQYDGMSYDWKFAHVDGYDQCNNCHDPHSLEVKLDECQTCHTEATTVEDLRDIRMMASLPVDYDGDGDLEEGIYYEITGLQEMLYTAIQAYASEDAGSTICYGPGAYPYWFIDTDSSGGECADSEASYPNRFASWTERLVRATYNYQFSKKDPGAFAHNAKYVIELLYDSIADLNSALSSPVDLSAAARTDVGHFDGTTEAFRHWDEDEAVSASCSRCHGGEEGFRTFVAFDVTLPTNQPNGLGCGTCHDTYETGDDSAWSVVEIPNVTFPSGETIALTSAGHQDNICGSCHQGRSSGDEVAAAIASGSPRFLNIHYLPSAATRYGADASVGYEYSGMSYSGKFTFSAHDSCSNCHDPVVTDHTFHPSDQPTCTTAGCHTAQSGGVVANIRHPSGHGGTDYDGDSDTSETLGAELETFADRVLAAMQAHANADSSLGAICYEGHTYPYWFVDTDSSGGTCATGEATYPNRYTTWDAGLAAAAFNYQFWSKDPGAWAHNFDYMAQLLYDSVADLSGDTSGLTRPTP